MLDLNDLRVFAVVARKGTLSAAARELRLPTSTIARSITRLEEHLNVLLMRRGPRGISLTDAGTEFWQTCKQTLQAVKMGSEALHDRRVNPCGLITVSSSATLARSVLFPILPEFLRRYSDLRVEIETYTSDWEQEPREDVDVFFKIALPRESPRRMRTFPSTLRGLFASGEYVRRVGNPTSPEELLAHSCIGTETWRLRNGQEIVEVAPQFRVATTDPFGMFDLVLEGIGIAMLPLYVANQPVVSRRLVPILPLWLTQPITHYALYFGSTRVVPKVRVFLDYIAEFFGTERDPRIGDAPTEGLFARNDDRALAEHVKPFCLIATPHSNFKSTEVTPRSHAHPVQAVGD